MRGQRSKSKVTVKSSAQGCSSEVGENMCGMEREEADGVAIKCTGKWLGRAWLGTGSSPRIWGDVHRSFLLFGQCKCAIPGSPSLAPYRYTHSSLCDQTLVTIHGFIPDIQDISEWKRRRKEKKKIDRQYA